MFVFGIKSGQEVGKGEIWSKNMNKEHVTWKRGGLVETFIAGDDCRMGLGGTPFELCTNMWILVEQHKEHKGRYHVCVL